MAINRAPSFVFIKNNESYTNEDVCKPIGDFGCGFLYRLDWIKDEENPFEIADRIANAIKEAWGLVIFDCEYYYSQHVRATVMDLLSSPGEHSIDEVVAWLMLRAFTKLGFKYINECEMHEWRAGYAHSGNYPPYILSTEYKHTYNGRSYDTDEHRHIKNTYEYEQIKKDNCALNHELLYHPRFIAKWLNEGHELEDYLRVE